MDHKDASAFNREHALNQAFGRFQDNLVLDCVCQDCNTLLGRDLDEKLARDSMAGLDRFRFGLKSAADYRSLGRRTSHEVEVVAAESDYLKGAIARYVAVPGEGPKLGLELAPQVGLGRSPDDLHWYPIDDLPDVAERTRIGCGPGTTISIRIQGMALADAQSALAAAGLPSGPIEETAPPAGPVRTHTRFPMGDAEFRAVTKIAFNYLAATTSPSVARMAEFNEVRRYVRYGEDPGRKVIVAVDESPVTVSQGPHGPDVLGHYVAMTQLQQVLVDLSLFCRLRYRIALAVVPFLTARLPSSAHFFDLEQRRVVPISLAVAARPESKLS